MDKSKYGTLIVSLIVLILFAVVVAGVTPPPGTTVADLLNNAVVLVIGYWLGSSKGSSDKDATIAGLSDSANKVATAAVQTTNTAAVVADTAAKVAAKVPGGTVP